MKQDRDQVRKNVQEDYTRAVKAKSGCGCGCSSEPVMKGAAAKSAGYTKEELKALPADAVENSFGCGNPLAMTEVREGQTVLDLGSGAGIDLLIASQKVGPKGKVIGIDMTDAMIERARANAAAVGASNVEVRKGIIEELPVENGSVDWVISNCVINLSPEKEKVFGEISRVLRPGGAMLVSDIVAEDLPPELRASRYIHSACLAGAISEKEYVEGLRKAGLTEVAVRDRLVYNPAQLADLLESEKAGEWTDRLAGKVASIRVFARKKR
jgi:arsenite methyltransferase